MICETIRKLRLKSSLLPEHEEALVYATQALLVIFCTTVRLACIAGAGLWLDWGEGAVAHTAFDHGARSVRPRWVQCQRLSFASPLGRTADILERAEFGRERSCILFSAHDCCRIYNGLMTFSWIFYQTPPFTSHWRLRPVYRLI